MGSFSEKQLKDIWAKAKIVSEDYKDEWRKDYAGAWINWDKYGDHTSLYGWDVDHAKPLSKNGADDTTNWIPLQWENNKMKADNYPEFQTSVSSENDKNIHKIQDWKY